MFRKRSGDRSEPKIGSEKKPANKYRKICRALMTCFFALIRLNILALPCLKTNRYYDCAFLSPLECLKTISCVKLRGFTKKQKLIRATIKCTI